MLGIFLLFPQALDRINEIDDQMDGNLQSTSSDTLATPTNAVPALGEDHPSHGLLDEVDVTIRIAFVQFLFDDELLGHIDQHLCIYRLFPRPVVALRNSAFLAAYRNSISTNDTQFIQELIKTQVGVALSYVWS